MSQATEQATTAAIKASAATSKTGGAAAIVSGGVGVTGWLAANYEWLAGLGVMVGIFVGIAGLCANVYFQWRRDQYMRQNHDIGGNHDNYSP